ncbi:Crinkler (CRN), partial [Phytophthora megakarya]
LFLAKKDDGAWLPHDDALDALMWNGFDTSSNAKMNPLQTLNESELFGPEISLREKVVHVLVEIPNDTTQETIALPDEKMRTILNEALNEVLDKRDE